MESTAFEMGRAISPIIVGIIGFYIGYRIYKNKQKIEELEKRKK